MHIEDSKVVEFLEIFSIDVEKSEILNFREFVLRIAIFRLENPSEKYGSGAILREMARNKKRYYLDFDQSMKRGLRAIFDAGEEVQNQLGVYPKKQTVCYLAWALSDFLI